MPTDRTVILEHRPGELARLGEVAGEAGVSIRGLAAFTGEGSGVVHLLLDDRGRDPIPGGARARRNRHRRPARGPGGRDRGPWAGIPDKMRILVHALPARSQIDTLVQEQLIVEYYSK
jgi:hypothetical protein